MNSIFRQFLDYLTPVANQGVIDSCWAFPIVDIIAAYCYMEQKEHVNKILAPVSRQQLIDKAPEMPKKRRCMKRVTQIV